MTRNSWTIFDGWDCPKDEVFLPDWKVFDSLESHALMYFNHQASGMKLLLKSWDQALNAFDGDPSRINWKLFRPLRLGREEDWSDWLGYFIESSKTGCFGKELFGSPDMNPTEFIPKSVKREEATTNYRADIVIAWDTHRNSQVEVKLWDQSYEKTFITSEELQASRKGVRDAQTWTHYILLPSKMEGVWSDCVAAITTNVRVQVLTWENVALAFRRVLRAQSEDVRWRALAYNYLGAIEQKILGFPRIGVSGDGASFFLKQQKLAEFSEFLQKGLSNE